MINNGMYGLGWYASIVLLKSIHRLFMPFGYAGIVLACCSDRAWPRARSTALIAASMIAGLSPYVLNTFTDRIASRHFYLSSCVFAIALSASILRLRRESLQLGALFLFVAFNIGVQWIRHDRNMERRTAPTQALAEELRRWDPGPVLLINFDYSAPDIAKSVAITIPGWNWNDVELSPPAPPCQACVTLKWDPIARHNIELTAGR